MALKDYSEFADPDLELPYRGKVYRVPAASIEVGRQLALLQDGDEEMKAKPAEWLWQLTLGPVFDEMVADQVPGKLLARAGQTALADFVGGRELAEATWENGIGPKALQALIASQSEEASEPSTSTDGATETP